MRRPIILFTLSLMIGIIDGYIYFERNLKLYSVAFGIGFLVLFSVYSEIWEIKQRDVKRSILIAVCGILIFSNMYLKYEKAYSVCEYKKAENIKNVGVVIRVENSDEIIKFLVKEEDGRRILCKQYKHTNGTVGEGTEEIKEGDIIETSGNLKIPEKVRNPRCFNYRLYLKSKKISGNKTVNSIKIIGKAGGIKWEIKRKLNDIKDEFLDSFEEDSKVKAFVKGVVFGDSSLIQEDTIEEFRQNGTAHVIAVSGLHIGFIVCMLKLLTGASKTISITIGITGIIVLYGELTNWNVSTIRSVIVIIFALFSFYLKRPFDLLSGVSAAAIIMLLANPYYLFNTSFQMSFLAMLGISFPGKSLAKIFGRTLGIMLGIQLVMAAFCAFSFNTFNPMSILINIPVIFIISILVPVSMICLCAGGVTGIWLNSFRMLIISLSKLVLFINHELNFDGALTLDVLSIEIQSFIIIMALMLHLSSEQVKIWLIRREWQKLRKSLMVIIIFSMMTGAPFTNDFLKNELVFIDVGQGDAIHLKVREGFFGKKDVLFDGGGSRDCNIGKKILKHYLLKNGAYKIDASIISHLHMDHFKAVQELSNIYPVERTFLSEVSRTESLNSYNKMNSESIKYIDMGSKVKIGKSAIISVVWPKASLKEESSSSADDENERNMVVLLEYRGVRVLITGDLTGEDEAEMIDYYMKRDGDYAAISCDILKACHHGSKYSNTDEFLDAVSPGIVVIQAGKNNIYGHPHRETLRRFESHNIEVHRTDREGAIGIDISKQGKIKIRSMIN